MTKWFFLLVLSILHHTASAQHISVRSPNGKVEVQLQHTRELTYSVYLRHNLLLQNSVIDLTLSDGTRLSKDLTIDSVKQQRHQSDIISPVPEKRRRIPDHYNEVEIGFRQPFTLTFRAYDDGVAYRISTRFADSIKVRKETALFRFPQNFDAWFPEVQPRADADSFHTSFEENYTVKPLDSITSANLMFNPVMIAAGEQAKVLLTESDLEDYPGMFLRGTAGTALTGTFAPYPLEEKMQGEGFSQAVVTKRADYIAYTQGTRHLPWRVMVIAGQDKELPGNDLVYRLASPSRLKDTSWIRPGKSTEEWIIGLNLYQVPFHAGINTATYQYYIDFAKRFGFERILLDAGWSDNNDLFKITPGLDMDSLVAYAKQQGIELSLWTLAATLNRQLEPALEQFNRWGITYIMTDFIDRDDQKMVNFHFRVAEACARHKIMLMFHGTFKPAGFNRTWPNALTREAVLGSEYNAWSDRATPQHNVTLPFIRMVAGPLDYEPGLLQNATKEIFRPISNYVMSQGTRCHQLAMFVVYDSPMQFFSGNPSTGFQEPDFMEILGSIPTVWDETQILDGKVGEYIATLREKDGNFYIGAMTNWTSRTLKINLNFLKEGSYELTQVADGVNAERYAADYSITKKKVSREDTLEINMAPGGGFMARLKKVK